MVSAETPRPNPQARSSASLADALLVIAESFLTRKIADADNPDLYQARQREREEAGRREHQAQAA